MSSQRICDENLKTYANFLKGKISASAFGGAARIFEPGLAAHQIEAGGFWRPGTDLSDEVLRSRLGITNGVVLLSRQTGVDGELADFGRVSQGQYRVQSEVGRLVTFDLSLFATGADGLIRGTLMATGSKSSTGNGTDRQLGAVAATQKLYAVLQVFSGSGTLDVLVRSDTTGFPSPTTRVTFGQKTGRAAEYATPVAGAITDDWWDVSWTITGGPWVFAVAVGIF